MTEQHEQLLKQWLNSSKVHNPSSETDEAILQRAKTESKRTDSPVETSWLNSTAMAFSALTITIITLFTLGQLTSPTEVEQEYVNRAITDNIEQATTHVDPNPTENIALTQGVQKPSVSLDFGAHAGSDFELPSTQQVLQKIPLFANQDRVQTARLISNALIEINQMLVAGDLKTARQRYQRLRQRCDSCELPSTLEALALSTNSGKLDSG